MSNDLVVEKWTVHLLNITMGQTFLLPSAYDCLLPDTLINTSAHRQI